jgi:hypothetical protein
MTLTDWGRKRLQVMYMALEDEYDPQLRDNLNREIAYLEQLDNPLISASANYEIPWTDTTAVLMDGTEGDVI